MVFSSDVTKTGATMVKEKNATMIVYWILSLVGLFFVGLSYSYAIPISNILIKVFAENGTPVAEMMWIRTCTIWGLGIIGVSCIAIAFMASYIHTYDQGQADQSGGWAR